MYHIDAAQLRAAAATVYHGSQPKLLLAHVLIDSMAAAGGPAQVDTATAAGMLRMHPDGVLPLLRGDPCLRVFGTAAGMAVTLDAAPLLHLGGRSSSGGGGPGGMQPYPGYGMQHPGQMPYVAPPWHHQQQQQYPQQFPQQQFPGYEPHMGPPQYQQQPYMQPQKHQPGYMHHQQQQGPYLQRVPSGQYPQAHAGINGSPHQPQPPPPPGQAGSRGRRLGSGQQQDTGSMRGEAGTSADGSSGPSSSNQGKGGQMGLHNPQPPDQQHSEQQQQPSSVGANSGTTLLAALQQRGAGANNRSHPAAAGPGQNAGAAPAGPDSSSSSSRVAATRTALDSGGHDGGGRGGGAGSSGGPLSIAAAAGAGGQPGASSSSAVPGAQQGQASAAVQGGRVDPMGICLIGIPPETTRQQLEAVFAAYGRVVAVNIITSKWHTTKCAFVVFTKEAAAQQALSTQTVTMNGVVVSVKPKVMKGKQTDAAAGASGAPQPKTAAQQGAKQPAAAAAGGGKQSKLLGHNEEGLPMLRGAPCCPFYMGIGECAFKNNCKYHHPRFALHPDCLLAGRKPLRYDQNHTPSYARLVNFTERLWDYDSCVEAQLKIWLARHLLASENSGCGMFDESAAVPAAPEREHVPNDSQPLGPYSCTIAEADQLLQLLWRAQPDEAAQQVMPYKGRVWWLLADDPYYALKNDPSGAADPIKSWVQLRVANIRALLNY